MKEAKKKSLSQIKKQLDKYFSLYVRSRELKEGKAMCVCCGVKKRPEEMQCGHYVSRSNLSLRWDERNGWPCCIGCNVFKHGNYPAYTEYLINRFGAPWLQNLIKEGKMIRKWTHKELEELLQYYKSKII